MIEQTKDFDPKFVLTNDPTPSNGPPIITKTGVVLGGNSRAMTLNRLFREGRQEEYLRALRENAENFGIDSNSIEDFDSPILVRKVQDAPSDVESLRALGSDLNRGFTAELSSFEKAVSSGKRVSQETVDVISEKLDESGDNATLRQLFSKESALILNRLVKDGVISQRELPQFIDQKRNLLTEAGKDFIEKALLGSVIDDPVILSNTPANVRNKITVSLASLSKIKSRGGDWDILADLMKATEATIEATAKGMTGDQFLSQSDLFDDGRLSDRSADLFRALMHDKPNLWKKKLSRYAAEAQADIDGQSSFFEKKTPEETFDEIFGRLETGVDAIKIPGLPRIAKTFNQAKEAVKKFLNKGIKNTETGLVASVSNESLRKILSNSSVSRSVSPEAHSLATANIDHLFKIAKRTESRGDKRGDINIKSIQRFSAPMQFKGETLQAKILVKEFASEEQGARIYNVEAIQIEKPSRRPASEEGIEPEDLDPPGREGSFNTNVDQEPGNVKRANNDPDTDKNQGDNDSLRAASFQVELQKEPTTDQTINKQEILDLVEATFGMVVRGKATHAMRDAAGWRERHSELIRLKKGRFAHVEVLAHEIAHGIDAEIERAWPNRFKTNQQLINSRVDSWKVQSLPKEIRKKAILELKDLDYDQEKRRTHEGFAEFMRHFLTTGKHEELAPTYSKWFQETFLKQAMVNDAGKMFLPAPKEAVKSFSLVKKTDAIEKPKGFRPISGKFGALKKALEIWYAQGSVNRMRAQIDFTGKLQNSEETASRKAYKTIIKEFYDSNFLFEEVTQAVEKKTGKKIPPNRDPFELATFYKGKVASIAETMIRKTMVDPMGNRVGPSLVEAIKPAKLNTKKKMEDWITYVVALKAKNNTRRGLETGFDIVDIDNVIKEFEGNEGWLEAAKGVTEWSNQLMDWYVWSGDISPELKNLFRDLNPIYMPFSRIFRESLQVGTGGGGNFEQKARAIKKQKGSTRPIKNPMDAFIESAAAIVSRSIKTRIANSLADFSREKGVGGIITEIPSALHVKKFKAEKIMDQLAEMGVDISELDPEEVLNLWYRDANFYGKDNVFAVWRRGELKLFEVHPELYQAIKETDTHRINSIVFRAFAGVARLMRLGFTGLNFGFSFFTNPIRDFVWSAVTTKKKFSTPLAPFRGLVKEWTAPKGSITDKALNSGLQMATMMGFDRKATTAMYDDLVTQQLSPFEKTLKVASSPTLLLDKIRQAFQVAELAPRVVELETYERIQKENPNWSPDAVFIKAFNNAQDVTVNFTKSGRTGKFINQYTAFHNVSWQGPNKLFRAFKEAPIRTLWFGFLWVTLPAMIAWDLEKDKEWYKNIPPEWKYMNMWIEDESTGKVIRVPGAHELYLLLGGLPVAGLDQEHLKDPKAVKGTLEAIKKLLVAPLDVTPSALKPLLEVGTNSNWLGHPIEPEWMRDNKTGLPVEDRKFFFTPELSEIAAKTINQFSDTKVSPIQMDHILRQMTGGLYQKGLGILDTERESHKHPLNPMAVLKFKNRPTRQLNDFFTLRTDLQQKKNAKKANSKEIGKLKLMERFYKGQIRPLQTKIREQQKLKTLKSIEAIDRMYGVMADRFNRFNKNILSKEK